MKNFLMAFTLLLIALGANALAEDKAAAPKKEAHEHSAEEAEHHEEDGGHEEGSAAVGPGKGILEKGTLGIKLSPEAVKTISPSTIPWAGGPIVIPYKALVRTKSAKSIFRVRSGWYKQVPAAVMNRTGDKVTVTVSGLEIGDLIVTSNAGFLRMAQVITEEGAAHSH